jgi:hypothetical protein
MSNTHFIHDPRRHGWSADHRQVRILMGLPPGKLSKEGKSPAIIQGIRVFLLPSMPGFRRAQHRMHAICPECERDLSVARLRQHVCR